MIRKPILDNGIIGAPTYQGLSYGGAVEYLADGTFEKADYPGLRAIRITSQPSELITADQLADSEPIVIPSPLYGVYSNYTPTITADGGSPGIGNGTTEGRFARLGRLVHGYFRINFGSSTSFGTGTTYIAAPTTISGIWDYAPLGVGETYDSSLAQVGNFILQQEATNDRFRMPMINGTSAASRMVNATSPMTWAAGDVLHGSFTYEADPDDDPVYVELLY